MSHAEKTRWSKFRTFLYLGLFERRNPWTRLARREAAFFTRERRPRRGARRDLASRGVGVRRVEVAQAEQVRLEVEVRHSMKAVLWTPSGTPRYKRGVGVSSGEVGLRGGAGSPRWLVFGTCAACWFRIHIGWVKKTSVNTGPRQGNVRDDLPG